MPKQPYHKQKQQKERPKQQLHTKLRPQQSIKDTNMKRTPRTATSMPQKQTDIQAQPGQHIQQENKKNKHVAQNAMQ